MKLKEIVSEIIKGNDWLNGIYDYRDGDLVAIVNQPEKFEGEPLEITELKELYSKLKNYDGTYKHKNLLFFNDSQKYGTFVYDINDTDRKNYIEHLSMHVIPFEHFEQLINDLAKD